MRQPIDLVGGFYTDESLPWSAQDTVNYIPVAAEVAGTRTPTKLVDAPGLRPFVAIGNTDGDPTAGAPIRGLHDVEGRLFVVSGRMLYEISQEGVAIPRGTIPGVGRVSMAHNQRGHGHELLVVNGSGGYVYNTANDTFTIVTDPGYPGAGIADFLDGYLMQVEPFGRFLFHSDLADALEYNTLDRFEAETQPDRVVGMIVNHQEVWAFGDRTIDVFGNVGTAQGTFQNKGVSISRGCIAKWSPAIIDNGVAWLGDDRVVYHARGYDPVRISTRAIEVALSECSLTDIRNAFSLVWSDRGHSVYYLTVPNGQTFGYDFSTGLWHRRASWHPERDIGGRWRLADLVRHNGQWIGGDYRDGRLYALDWDYMLEGTEPLIRERVAPLPHNDGRGLNVHSVDLLYDTGGPETDMSDYQWPEQPLGPTIEGDAPDSIVGASYSYTYTVTPGDNAVSSVEVISGELPPGLALGNDGTLSGTPTAGGQYSWVVRATDAIGLYDEQPDAALIRAEQWWATVPGFFTTIRISNDDALNWQGVPVNENSLFQPHYGPVQLGDKVIFPIDAGSGAGVSDAFRSSATVLTSSLEVEPIIVPTHVHHWRYIDGIGFACRRASLGLPSQYTLDQGDTWHDCFVPPSGGAGDIAKIGDRWVTHNLSVSGAFYYSDDEVPTNWVRGNSAGNGHEVIASNGSVAISFDNLDSCRRTVDGSFWSIINVADHDVGGPNGGDCVAIGDVFLFSRRSSASPGQITIMRSADAGLTWHVVVLDEVTGEVRRFERSDTGRIVAFVSGGSWAYYSDDLGATWTRVTVASGASRTVGACIKVTA